MPAVDRDDEEADRVIELSNLQDSPSISFAAG
jgi:hypothetical protein